MAHRFGVHFNRQDKLKVKEVQLVGKTRCTVPPVVTSVSCHKNHSNLE